MIYYTKYRMYIGKTIIDIVKPRRRDSCYGIILKKIPFGYLVTKYKMYIYNMAYWS